MKTKVFGIVLFVTVSVVATSQIVQHEVQNGETLYSIARRYDTTIDRLIETNEIVAPELLLPGTLLTIPSRYAVEKGDTLYGIAQRFDTSVDEITSQNRLSNSEIRIGQVLILPGDVSAQAVIVSSRDNQNDDTSSAESDEDEPAAISNDEERSDSDQIAVAAEVSDPISFAEGGVWPVAGNRRRLDGKLPGVMIRAERGSMVYAISSGRVVYAGPHTTFGNVVFIQSNQDYVYVYGGQESIDVEIGELIEAGAPIGTVGLSPSDGIAALYFSVWRDDQFIDPESAPRG